MCCWGPFIPCWLPGTALRLAERLRPLPAPQRVIDLKATSISCPSPPNVPAAPSGLFTTGVHNSVMAAPQVDVRCLRGRKRRIRHIGIFWRCGDQACRCFSLCSGAPALYLWAMLAADYCHSDCMVSTMCTSTSAEEHCAPLITSPHIRAPYKVIERCRLIARGVPLLARPVLASSIGLHSCQEHSCQQDELD